MATEDKRDDIEGDPGAPRDPAGFDPDRLARNLVRLTEEAGKAFSAYWRPREEEGRLLDRPGDIAPVLRSLGAIAASWLRHPDKLAEAQRKLFAGYADVWASALRRWDGEPEPTASTDPADRRFKGDGWSRPFFDFLRRSYLVTSRWTRDMVEGAEDVDAGTRHRAEFILRQILAALSPANFVFTNPELLKRTVETNGENLVRGMRMLAEDIAAGGGNLRIRQADLTAFEVGKNLATTPGKVIHQNEVCQVIQYRATTPQVLKRPLLIVPPWINKFYVLDLTPEKSFIRWAVAQGHTVFVVSWVNPDRRHAGKSFEHYMKEGVLEALSVIGAATGERSVNAVGYCVGGTLLAVTLAYMAATGDDRIASATLFATQVDFTNAGDLKVFVDEGQVSAIEEQMTARGYLEGDRMAAAFNMLRPDDLIWPYIVNDYLMGEPPKAFDLLFWNADATRMPAANHSFYLRNCYLENRLAQGQMVVAGVTLDLGKVGVPIYNLATREDHIAPALSVLKGCSLFGGPVELVIAGSGHIAGVINPPERKKYQYWTGGDPASPDVESWIATATEHPGSWWPHWQRWIEAHDATRVKARRIGGGRLKAIEDAPGSFVRVKA